MRGAALALLLSAAAAWGAEEPTSEVIEHVVAQGESLWSIAGLAHVYDDPYLWPVIYKFNRDQIPDPRVIYPHQRLQIPTHVDAETRRAARREAGANPR